MNIITVLVKYSVENERVLFNVFCQIDLLSRYPGLLEFSDNELSVLTCYNIHVIIGCFFLAERSLPDYHVDLRHRRHSLYEI